MRWWHILFPPLEETPQGLYRPSNRFIDYGMPVIGALVIVGAFLKASLAGKTNYFILGYLGFVIAPMGLAWRNRRKFGRLGRPLVRVDGAGVYMSMPQNVHPGHVLVPLADLQALVIKGVPGQRSYVFVRHGGDPITVRPGFGRLDSRVVDFLQRSVPASISVEVQEPPTFLGAIRGE